MRRIAKWMGGGLAVLVLLAAVAGLLGFLVLKGTVPPNSKSASLSGLSNPVEVVFDREAIPHIVAETH
ncbi:MAG: hypothetical protein AAFN43_12650, partial [Pseudomonadota bacterium]